MQNKKNITIQKLINLFAVLVMIVLAVFKAAGGWKFHPEENKYAKHMEAAVSYMNDGYYVEAIEEYRKANELNPSCDAKLSEAECYLLLGDMISFKQEADNAKKLYGNSERLCMDMVYYYEYMNDRASEIKLLAEAIQEYPDSEYLNMCYDSVKGDYSVEGSTYDMVYALQEGYDIAIDGECCSVITGNATVVGNTSYEAVYDVHVEDELRLSALREGQIKYYDNKGYMRKTPEGEYSYLGVIRDGYALVKNAEGWGYIDAEGQMLNEIYEEATAFSEGVAAIKKEGKWMLVDCDFQPVTEETYEDVIRDAGNCCVFAGRIFAKKGNEYVMLDTEGTGISSGYSEIKPFMEKDGYAAVCDSEGWKVINTEGAFIESVACDELCASGNGMMAYRVGEKWGYIGVGDGVYVEPVFDNALRVNSAGYAAVQEGEQWKYIHFTRFEATY